jgi:hypothetical protein
VDKCPLGKNKTRWAPWGGDARKFLFGCLSCFSRAKGKSRFSINQHKTLRLEKKKTKPKKHDFGDRKQRAASQALK